MAKFRSHLEKNLSMMRKIMYTVKTMNHVDASAEFSNFTIGSGT